MHMRRCEKCRLEVSMLRKNLYSCMNTIPFPVRRDMSDSIMSIIGSMEFQGRPGVSNLKWVVSGMVILGSIFLIPFDSSMLWLRDRFGGNLDIPLTIVMGAVISAYATLFTATHLDNYRLRNLIQRLKNPNS